MLSDQRLMKTMSPFHLSKILLLILVFACNLRYVFSNYEAPEPYDEMHGFSHHPRVPESPDPLIATTWSSDIDDSVLQYYRVFHPVSYQVSPKEAIQGLDSLMFTSSNSRPLKVTKSCTLMLDWGVERAAWFELTSPDNLLPNSTDFQVQASLSEFNIPYPGKTKPLIGYGNHTYRLETNNKLYEGVRFTWLSFEIPEDTQRSIQITNVSLVAKIKPVNYTGSFWSSNEELTRAWYTGAYGVRLNMEESDLNSILIERGDRVAIQGDGHPTIAAALVAFSPYKLVANVLNRTDSGDHHVVDESIMAYPLFWCLSAMDYFMESGDVDTFRSLAKDMMTIIDPRIYDFLAPDLDITWFGWDDRLGNGWCFHEKGDHCPKEAHLAFAALVVRVCKDFTRMLKLANMPLASQKYQAVYHDLGKRLVAVPEWPRGFGVHAAANAINAGIANTIETDFWMTSVLNNPVTICSFSQFNQYWILQALGNAGRMEHAIASIKLCWGTPMKLGRGCFWENSSPEWLRFMKEGDVCPGLQSYCHPWASGVTAWLSHSLGGIQPLLPGYKSFLAAPYVSESHPAVSSGISSRYGKFVVNATLSKERQGISRMRALVVSPVPGYFGVRPHLLLPTGEQGGLLETVYLNQEKVSILTAKDLEDLSVAPLPEGLHFVAIKEGGAFEISAVYKEITSNQLPGQDRGASPFSKSHYPATIIGIDAERRGDGLHAHGKDGYVLFGCDAGNDTVKLPDYVHNVSIMQHGYPGWLVPERDFIGSSPDNETFLPVGRSPERKLGMVGYDQTQGGEINNYFIHVELKERNTPFLLSVYFVAKSSETKHVVQTMDLETLNIIAPTTLIKNYTGGVWWTVKYNKSIRLRLISIRGIRVSGIAFSSN